MNKISFQYDKLSYASILETLASEVNAVINDNSFQFPNSVATGHVKRVSMPNGLDVLIVECTAVEDIVLQRNMGDESVFALCFYEVNSVDKLTIEINTPASSQFTIVKAGVLLNKGNEAFSCTLKKGLKLKCISILMHETWLTSHLKMSGGHHLLKAYFENYQVGNCYEKLDSEYLRLMKIIASCPNHPFPDMHILNRLMLLIERFFTRVHLRLHPGNAGGSLTKDDVEKLSIVEQELLQDFSRKAPTISVLARQVGMSSSKLKNSFKQFFGMPVYSYYLHHKMNLAKEMLLSGEHAVKNVGMSLGYRNLSHFAAAFKKETGVLPGELLQ